MSKPKPPEHLGSAGKSVWTKILKNYDFRPDELLTLEDACATSDMIATLTDLWIDEGSPATAKGSMGQLIIHPLIGEIRTQRAARNALWRQLKLPDLEGGAGEKPATNPARAAADSRWKHGS